MDDEEFDLMLFWFLKLRKIRSQNVEKERRIWIRKIFEKRLFFCTVFLQLSDRQGYFLTFSTNDFYWLNKGGGLLILFSWLSFSQSLLIFFFFCYILELYVDFFHFFKKNAEEKHLAHEMSRIVAVIAVVLFCFSFC